MRRIPDKSYKADHDIISNNKQSLDKIARKLLERETLEGWEVNEVLREDTGIDYIKMKEYYPEEAPGEKMTIAPGAGPSTGAQSPVPSPPPARASPPAREA